MKGVGYTESPRKEYNRKWHREFIHDYYYMKNLLGQTDSTKEWNVHLFLIKAHHTHLYTHTHTLHIVLSNVTTKYIILHMSMNL